MLNTKETRAGGVTMSEHRWPLGDAYTGTEAALVAAGLAKPEWFPGKPGNNITSQQVIFSEDGPRLLRGGQGNCRVKGDERFNRIIINRNGYADRFTVIKPWPKERCEELRRAEEARKQDEQKQEACKLAKLARERDYLTEWKTNVTTLAENIRDLAQGKRIFTGFPEIRLSDCSLRKVENAIAQLALAIEEAKPYTADIEVKKSNVISIRGEAFRYFQQA